MPSKSKRYVVQDVSSYNKGSKGGGGGDGDSSSSMGSSNSQASFGRRLALLLWKNMLLRRRHWVVTLAEIVLPTLIALTIAGARTAIVDENKTLMNTSTIFPPQDEGEMLSEARRTLFRKKSFLAYVPENNLTTQIMEDMAKRLKARKMELRPFVSEAELEAFNDQTELESAKDFVQRVRAAIIFGEAFHSGDIEDVKNVPDGRLDYTIRLPIYTIETRNNFPLIQFPGPSDDNAFSYVNGGFSGLQILMDKILIKLLTGEEIDHEISHQVFPYPPYNRTKGFDQLTSFGVPLLMIIGFVFIVPSIIIKIVSERETGIKELMKIMGLPNWIHWLGWMINSLLVLIISITVVIFCFFHTFSEETGPVLPYSNPEVWWLVFLFYVISATAFCFFISVLTDRATSATALGIVIWLVVYLGMAIPMEQNLEFISLPQKLASCLFPNMALHWAIKAMYSFETRGVGANWKTMWQPTSPIDGFALYHVFIMFIVDTIIFVALTIYLENILPSKYGIRKPWYYIFQWSTWCPDSDDHPKMVQSRRQSLAVPIERPGFEKEPVGLPAGVAIMNLKKIFGKKKAVDGVSLKMYEGQITALLGHNGAGKTTTLSILTGLYPPTTGTAAVNGYDIRSEMDKVRESLGLCPQHNMLFDRLTVWEHLILFGRLKGLSHDEAASESRTLIKKLQLKEKTHYMSCDLSGGQKRKLSLGMALIGGSKVVILDECTSGMDPEARRVIWDLLLEMRGQRTIILTTHFMEEADILGDRIAMMASGKIKCCGTPLYLKKFYGTGYTLKVITKGGEDQKHKEIFDVVQSVIPPAEMPEEQNGNNNSTSEQSEMSIYLPNDEKTLESFPEMFSKLNTEKESLGIVTVVLSLATIDQVFMKIGELEAAEEDKNHKQSNGHAMNGSMNTSTSSMEKGGDEETRRPRRRLVHQLYGLFQKKYNFTIRNKKLLLSQFVMPPLLLICAILLSTRAYSPAQSSPALKMNISQFKTAVTLFSTPDEELKTIYADLVGEDAQPQWIDGNKTDIIHRLLEVANEDLGVYRDQYMVAADMNSTKVNALYNSIPYHSAPVSMNLITNTLLRTKTDKNYSLDIIYHPLENQLFATLQAAQPNPSFTLLVPIVFGALVPIGLALFAASYAVFPTEERLSNSKQLQLMTGVNTLTFWGTSFAWDFLLMGIAIMAMVVWFPVFEINGSFTAFQGFWAIIGILLLYGYSAISFSYLFSLVAPSSAFAFAWTTIIHVLFGMIIPIMFFFADNLNFTDSLILFRWVSRSIASFGGSMSIMRYAAIATSNSRCSILTSKELDIICNPKYQVDGQLRQCCPNCKEFYNEYTPDVPPCFEPEQFFTWNYTYTSATDAKKYTIPGIGQEMLYVLIVALIYQLLIILVEGGIFSKLKQALNRFSDSGTSKSLEAMEKAEGYTVDEDVQAEKERILSMNKTDDALVVTNLSKNFGSFAAVREINFGVHPGECFGLLGVNGAGKTTTFRMLTGDEEMSSGNAFTFGQSLSGGRADFFSNIGYCPQFDAIIGSLSGREMLTLFCHLRGVPFNETKKEVEKWLKKLGLEKAGDVPSGSYSGGMKRRLNVGIAMIGDPPVVLLDEPTSGVDPASRRQFWEVIASAKASGQSVILTSHSMDEIEVLCSRLGIMVNGRFQCLGSAEYLRNKFAHGYTLVLRLKHHHMHGSPVIAQLKEEIMARFEPCELQDEHQNILQFQLHNSSIPWDTIFRNMEEIKKILVHIDDVDNHHVPSPPPSLLDRRDSLKIVLAEENVTYASLIEDYTVSLTSLEEVFLAFARKQYTGRNAISSCFGLSLVCKACGGGH